MKARSIPGARLFSGIFGLLSLLVCLAAAAPPLSDAKAYVIGIYRQIPENFDYHTVRYAARLGGLLRRDAAFSRRSGDVGVLDGVPFCDCQDTTPNYRILQSAVESRGSNGAAVSVQIRNGSENRRFTIDLVHEGGEWLVADVHGHDTPSLLALLEREVPREEKSLTPQERRK